MKKKKIIFTVTNDLNYDQRMQRICGSLSKNGYEVLLIGRKRSFSKALVAHNFKQKRFRLLFHKGALFYTEYNIRLFLYLLFAKFDIICSIDLDTILPGYFIAKIRHKICVYDAHEYFTEVPELVERPKVKKIWERIADITIPNIRHCYTVGESLAEILSKKYNTIFTTIRNVPLERTFPNSKTPKENILLYQGVLNDGRGLEEMIAAMPMLPDAKLWLAGEGDLSEVLRAEVKTLQLENQVKFLGYVLPKDLPAITRKAKIGLNLLRNKGLNYYYSLANKAFDYVNAAVPIVQVNFPEYQKLNAAFEVAVLVDDLEPETLAAACRKFLDNEIYYNQIKQNCKQARKVWNWENEEKKLVAFYDKLES